MKKALIGFVGFFLTVPYAHAGLTVSPGVISQATLPAGSLTINPALLPGTLGPITIQSSLSTQIGDVGSADWISSMTVSVHRSGEVFNYSSSSSVRDVMGFLNFTADDVGLGATSVELILPASFPGGSRTVRAGGCYNYGGGATPVKRFCNTALYLYSYVATGPWGGRYNRVEMPSGNYTFLIRYADGSRKQSIVVVPAAPSAGAYGPYGSGGPYGGPSF